MGRRKKAFSLYLRRVKLPGKKTPVKVYYYRTYDEYGRRTPGHSTSKATVAEAEEYCRKLQAAGQLVTGPIASEKSECSVPTLEQWGKTRRWWMWGECAYLKSQLNRSDPERPAVSRRYADDALRDLNAWILPYHGKKRLGAITPADCEDLLTTWQANGLSRKTINNKASVYRIMLGEAERLGIIERTPWARVQGFKPAPRRKGILTLEEARRLLHPATKTEVWNGNQLYHAANLTASLTGLRVGEVLALKHVDLFPDHLHIEHSWHIRYGEGATKTKRIDDIPIPRLLYDTIQSFLLWDGYIFSFSHADRRAGERPCTANRINDALKGALARIGIDEAQRSERNISFHSWRAFANTFMRARGISGEKVRQLTRHASEEMTEHYSAFRLEDFKDVAAAQEELVASFTDRPKS